MPLLEVPWANGWTAVPQVAGGTRVEARGIGMYVTTDAAPVAADFSTAIALPSNESLFVEAGAAALFVHASQPVVPARAFTTGAISQVTNGC